MNPLETCHAPTEWNMVEIAARSPEQLAQIVEVVGNSVQAARSELYAALSILRKLPRSD